MASTRATLIGEAATTAATTTPAIATTTTAGAPMASRMTARGGSSSANLPGGSGTGGGGGGGGQPPDGGGDGPDLGVPAAGAPPPPVVFARTPGELDANNIIDYSTREGRTMFKNAISELSEEKYDGKSEGINSFHEKLLRRANEFGWTNGDGDIVTVNGINSISHYGRVTMDDIRAEAQLYVNNMSRQTQNNEMMYRCIMNSLTEDCRNRLINRPAEYNIQIGNQSFISAILLHKVLDA